MTAVLEVHNLAKFHWKTRADEPKYLFSNISASLAEPERIVLIGASGQGKSTLLRILGMLDAPDEGEMKIHGISSREMSAKQWRMASCYVAQHAVMLPGSIEDNLCTVSRLHDKPYEAELAGRLLQELGLDYLDLSKQASDCSGGEKQRIALVRSLLLRPQVLLLDEITASLDINSLHKVEDLLLQWHKTEGTSFIWVTHDLEQAHRVSSSTWVMNQGRLEKHDSAAFFNEPVSVLAQKYIQPVEGIHHHDIDRT